MIRKLKVGWKGGFPNDSICDCHEDSWFTFREATFSTHFYCTAPNYVYIPFDDDLDIFEEPDGLLAVSGMCVNNALKKLYSCVRTHRVHHGCAAAKGIKRGIKKINWWIYVMNLTKAKIIDEFLCARQNSIINKEQHILLMYEHMFYHWIRSGGKSTLKSKSFSLSHNKSDYIHVWNWLCIFIYDRILLVIAFYCMLYLDPLERRNL